MWEALCLNIYFVSASVAGGCWRAFGSSGFAHFIIIVPPHAVQKRFGFGSYGLRLAFQSSLFRGLFFWTRMKSQKGRKDSRAFTAQPNKQSKELRHKPTASTHAIYSVPPCFACLALQLDMLSFFPFFLCGHFLSKVLK